MNRWQNWAIVILLGLLAFLWMTWPSPSVDQRVKIYQQVIEEQEQVIDSLQSLLRINADSLAVLKHLQKNDKAEFDKKMSRLQKQIKDNETIHTLPTPELDSIVRQLYGDGAI